MLWQRPRPVLAKASPAMEAAQCIFSRASLSSPFMYARGRFSKMRRAASTARGLEKGLALLDTKDSTAWVRASSPVWAVSRGGMDAASAGSRMATSGMSSGEKMACFLLGASSDIMAVAVASEPVPLVVGMATSLVRPKGGIERRGGKRMSSKLRPGCSKKTLIALAASMQEPPPRAMTRSGRKSRICCAPRSTVPMDGSGSTRSKSSHLTFASSRYFTVSSKPSVLTIVLSVTRKALLAPRAFRWMMLPHPKIMSRGNLTAL